jgi:hypothetical protein
VIASPSSANRAALQREFARLRRLLPSPPAARIAALVRTCRTLADDRSAQGAAARRELPRTTGLSREMVDWGLRQTCGQLTATLLRRQLSRGVTVTATAVSPRLVTLVLAGNVFTAGLPPILLALLHGSALVIKASQQERGFPRRFLAALRTADPRLARSVRLLTVPGEDASLDIAFRESDLVVGFGSDSTMAALRHRVPPPTSLREHGHGIGVGYVSRALLRDTRTAKRAATALALDVAAYDQRGCLSPQTVWVENGGPIEIRGFAALLAGALGECERKLPRGQLPPRAAAEQVQWRGVAAATGEIWDGGRFAVAYRGRRELSPTPGWRNIELCDCHGPAEMISEVLPLGRHLKAIGVGGDQELFQEVAKLLPASLCPRLSRLGAMQRVPLFDVADGTAADDGFLRWRVLAS